MSQSVIPRATKARIQRANAPVGFRDSSEERAAYEQAGYSPRHGVKSWYRDIYDFYQNNEC